jgi:hypothetical protein
MKKIERVMQNYSKEGIMVNHNLRKLLKIHLQEDHPCSSHKEASIMIMISQGKNSEGLPHNRSVTPRYANLFYGHCFYCTNFGHKVTNCRDYKRNVQARSAYVTPHNIECYKCHNHGHIASYCRSMIDTSMKANIDIRYKKVWIRKHEEQVNKNQVPEITRLEIK